MSAQWEPFNVLDQESFMFRTVPQETVSEGKNECIRHRPVTQVQMRSLSLREGGHTRVPNTVLIQPW